MAGLSTSKETRASNIVIDNFSKALDTFKGSHTKDHEVARCTILTSVTTDDGFKESKLQRQASRLLGVSTKTLRKVSAKRASIMLTPNSLWAYTERARKCDSLMMEARAYVKNFGWKTHAFVRMLNEQFEKELVVATGLKTHFTI